MPATYHLHTGDSKPYIQGKGAQHKYCWINIELWGRVGGGGYGDATPTPEPTAI